MRVLISDKLSEAGLDILKSAQKLTIDYQPGLGKDVPKLKAAIVEADAIVIRSGTTLTAEVLDAAKKLKVIGRAGIGVDNVDVAKATQMGIIVMNTPGGNVVTTAEHAIALMCSMARMIPQASQTTKSGKWEKNKFTGIELFKKTLGVIGVGNIGKVVVDRAQGLKMNVIAYDPFLSDEVAEKLNVKKVGLDELLASSDFITIHVPKNDKTAGMINAQAFAKMKRGVCLINCARGGIVNEKDLVEALEKGIVAKAALDVFEKEPVDPENPLLKMEQVIVTPHLGAATDEAQENVALEVADQIVAFLTQGTIMNSVNVPSISGELRKKMAPSLELCEKIGLLLGQLITQSPQEVDISYHGEMAEFPITSLTMSLVKGLLATICEGEGVNFINALSLAKQKGIKLKESKINDSADYATLLKVTVLLAGERWVISGSIFGKHHPRIVQINEVYLEALPRGHVLLVQNEDKPGVVGKVGQALGEASVNISRMQLGLDRKTELATAFYNLDGAPSAELMKKINSIPGIVSARSIDFGA